MAGSGTSAVGSGWPRGRAENEADHPPSSAARDIALGARRLDHRRVSSGFSGSRRHPTPTLGKLVFCGSQARRSGNCRLDGRPFHLRIRTLRPAEATTGCPALDRSAPISHYGFYILVALIVGTGSATAIIAGLGEIVFGLSGVRLPASLMIYPTFVVHVLFALLLVGLIILHVLVALYHQFVKMTTVPADVFGRHVSNPSVPAETATPNPCAGLITGVNTPRPRAVTPVIRVHEDVGTALQLGIDPARCLELERSDARPGDGRQLGGPRRLPSNQPEGRIR